MRTIKFRGKRIDNGEWVYGFLVINTGGKAYIKNTNYNVNNGKFDLIPDEVHPETVGQFTGLTDKNGVEIYEGDIVKNGLGEIVWHDIDAMFKVKWHDDTFRRVRGNSTDYSDGERIFRNHPITFEVIGNIHQNPELL